MKIIYNGEPDKRLYKEVIGQTIEELMHEDEKVVWLDADLTSCSGTNKGTGDRYVNCGIADRAFRLGNEAFHPYFRSIRIKTYIRSDIPLRRICRQLSDRDRN